MHTAQMSVQQNQFCIGHVFALLAYKISQILFEIFDWYRIVFEIVERKAVYLNTAEIISGFDTVLFFQIREQLLVIDAPAERFLAAVKEIGRINESCILHAH